MSWDAGFSGGTVQVPVYQEGMSLTEYALMVTAALVVTYSRQALEIVAKNIPDDETGVKGVVRDVCKALSGYTKNKEHAERPDYLGEPKDPPKP